MNPEEIASFNVRSARHAALDTLTWQVPSLCLAGQAFLFTIALGPSTSTVGRIVASVLALLSSTMCLQLLARHRLMGVREAKALKRIEDEPDNGLDLIHVPLEKGAELDHGQGPYGLRWIARKLSARSSFAVWFAGLSVFAVAAFVILVLSSVGMFHGLGVNASSQPAPTVTVTAPAPTPAAGSSPGAVTGP